MERTIGVAADSESDPRVVEHGHLGNGITPASYMRYSIFYQYGMRFSTGTHGLNRAAT
jgi:hypothetical protein